MNVFDKLRLIRDVIQQDVGNRGLARDPHDNLINACPDDFANACGIIATTPEPMLAIVTGFHIPSASPPASETDGPLGALFLARALWAQGTRAGILTDGTAMLAMVGGLKELNLAETIPIEELVEAEDSDDSDRHESVLEKCPICGSEMRRRTHRFGTFLSCAQYPACSGELDSLTNTLHRLTASKSPLSSNCQLIAIERVGPSKKDGRCYTMRGRDVTADTHSVDPLFDSYSVTTIGIGDGGNEIGMGKIPHETIVKNIPNGDLIHCRVSTDYLIVAGVSNWGAYALAAGVALLRGVDLPDELFDPDRERAILQTMVDAGPLVDGVTGQQTATVDGLSWEQYIAPLLRIREIMKM